MTRSPKLISLILALMLAACSGSDDDDEPSAGAEPPPPPVRGALIQSPPARTASITAEHLFALLSASSAGQQILEFITAPECGIDIHQLQYNTVAAADASTTASGALMIPTGDDPACQGPRPIVVYAHGTQVVRAYNIADVADEDNAEGLLVAAAFAAQGYIVVAPNYAGFDSSALTWHPFLNADQQSKDTVDALSAARSALPTSFAPGVTDSGKLFITGYSQGGYVAMATHRLLQQSGVAVTASAPMSGPYALGAFGDAVFYGNVVRSAPLFVTYLATGYQRAYSDVYTSPTDFFESRYATGVDTLLPTAGARSELFAQGKLPSDQLFSSTPPDASYAPYTPSTTPAELAHVFALGFGPDNLVTNAYRLAYLQDAQTNPDGGFPIRTDGLPAVSPANGLRKAFRANDLRNWTPASPLLLCAGNEDPTVLYMNTQLMQDYWAAHGAPASVRVLDLDSDLSLDDPEAARKVAFAAAKAAVAAEAIAAGATDNGAAAVSEAYHSTLVSPFCLSAARSFFDGL
ncbi:MAG: alpha/beta hydrolase family protein [Steroidobacter sp.]